MTSLWTSIGILIDLINAGFFAATVKYKVGSLGANSAFHEPGKNDSCKL